MQPIPVVEVRQDLATYHHAVCVEHEWEGSRHQHEADAYLELNGHLRSGEHTWMKVIKRRWVKETTYTMVEDGADAESSVSEIANGEKASA